MDEKTLEQLSARVTAAEKIKKQIAVLEEVEASCKAEIGFLNIIVNYRNQNEIRLVDDFTQKELFEHFKALILEGAINLKEILTEDFKKL